MGPAGRLPGLDRPGAQYRRAGRRRLDAGFCPLHQGTHPQQRLVATAAGSAPALNSLCMIGRVSSEKRPGKIRSPGQGASGGTGKAGASVPGGHITPTCITRHPGNPHIWRPLRLASGLTKTCAADRTEAFFSAFKTEALGPNGDQLLAASAQLCPVPCLAEPSNKYLCLSTFIHGPALHIKSDWCSRRAACHIVVAPNQQRDVGGEGTLAHCRRTPIYFSNTLRLAVIKPIFGLAPQ